MVAIFGDGWLPSLPSGWVLDRYLGDGWLPSSETGGCRPRQVAGSCQVSPGRVVAIFGDGWLPSPPSGWVLDRYLGDGWLPSSETGGCRLRPVAGSWSGISKTGGCRLRRRVVAVSHLQSRFESVEDGDGWLSSRTSSHTLRVDKRIRAPTQEPIKEKFSGERKRGFFLACLPLCRCVSAVCLSSCLCLGSSWPGWSGVCRVRCFVSCCFRGASFLVGAVPKTGNDTLGIPLPRARLRARFYLGYGAASLFIIFDIFTLIDVEASRITCCRGSRVGFTFVHVV